MRLRIVSKHGVISHLLLAKNRQLRRKQKKTVSCEHISCLHCYYKHSKCSLLALTHAVWCWRHCCTAHAWWHGLLWPRQ